jgi:hypothetical protein
VFYSVCRFVILGVDPGYLYEVVLDGSGCVTEFLFFLHFSEIRIVFSTGRGGAVGAKFRMSLALPVGAVMNCADNTGKYRQIV